ncbi:MAG TPA: DAK2 domain-containing protein [Rectinemataceae bacterium]|nr:DAK2 domain-containing protein [Rectinemataceae bacterium]
MKLYAKDIVGVFSSIAALLAEKKDTLTGLDSEVGDGDLGRTMVSGFKAALESLAAADDGADLSAMIMEAGLSMADNVPSTMGTLLSLGMIRAAREIKGCGFVDETAFGNMFRAAITGIEERPKAAAFPYTAFIGLVDSTPVHAAFDAASTHRAKSPPWAREAE